MRRTLIGTLSLSVLATVPVLVATPASATTPGGTYVALPVQSRIVDTRTGAGGNHKGAVGAGHSISATIGGRGGVPADAAAVAVTITAVSPTADGGIVGYVGARPSATNLQFSKAHAVTNAAILPLASGSVNLFNTASSGTVQLVVDVSGYYAGGAPSATDPGVFHAVTPVRAVNTVTGAGGNHKGALPAGHGITPSVGGQPGVPADAGAVAVTITVLNVKKAGSILAFRPGEPKQNLALLHFVPGQRASAFAVLRLSGPQVSLVNASGGTVDVIVDVAGYYNIGFAQTTNAFQTVVQTRITTRTIRANGTTAVTAGGLGGVPLAHVSAVLATVHAASPTKSGGLQAWKYGVSRPSSTTILQFAAKQTTSDVVLIPVSSSGKFDVHNSSAGSVSLVVDVDGYVPSTGVSAPAPTATARYVRNLTDGGPTDVTQMNQEGMDDAAAGYSFVLLDIGAQSNDGTGVVLSATTTKLTYAQLRAAVAAYLTGFATSGHTGRVAVGTNNSGDWSQNPADKRGSDWATQVVKPLATSAPAGISVVGAADFEAGFASTEPQAESWKSHFLANLPGTATSTALIFNGSADFCPKTWTAGAACNFGWTYQKLSGLAGGPRTMVLPQIYFGYMATEWAEIDKTGGGHLRFLGALTEFASDSGSLQPAQGYTALRRGVSSITATPIGSLVADIHADN